MFSGNGLRVLHVTPAVFGEGRRGGGERYVSELARAMYQAGASVLILEIRSYLNARLMRSDGSRSRIVGWSTIVRLMRSADVVHVHQLNSIGFDIAVLSLIGARTPLVLTDHGGGMRAAGRLLGRIRLRRIAGAAFVSQWSRGDIDPRGRILRYSIVFGGGDHLEPGAGGQSADVIFVGRLLPHKGAHVLLAALPPSVHALIVGEERDEQYASSLRVAASGKKVSFLPGASDEVMASALARARVLVVPSVPSYQGQSFARPELLGLVALEALALGVPVVGSDVGGLGEVLRFAGQEVVRPDDATALRGAIERVLSSELAVVTDTEAFAWGAVAGRCLALYRELTEEGR